LFADEFAVEALAFHCLHELLSGTDIKDLFTTLESDILLNRMHRFDVILKETIPDVSDRLRSLDIPTMCYSFRWFSLMFSQEYEMPALQQIWDALLTHFDDLVEFEFYVGAAQLEVMGPTMQFHDYGASIQGLQSLVVRDIYALLATADRFWKEGHSTSVVKQVTDTFQVIKRGFIGSVVPKIPFRMPRF
jgi:hypothetical protein